jgi:hypothetical protein
MAEYDKPAKKAKIEETKKGDDKKKEKKPLHPVFRFGSFPTWEELAEIVPEMSDEEYLKYKPTEDTKFFCGWEIYPSLHLYIVMGMDKKLKRLFGWVRAFEKEFGVLPYEDLSQMKPSRIMPMNETFRKGPKTAKELNDQFGPDGSISIPLQ